MLETKTHLLFNHSPITKLVIRQILELPRFAAARSRALIISTRGQRVDVPGVDEIGFEGEELAQSVEEAFRFFRDEPPYRFEALTVFLPQTRYPLGRYLLRSSQVETIHFIEEGVGTMAIGKLQTPRESSARNTRHGHGVLDNSLPARVAKTAHRVSRHLWRHPRRAPDLAELVRIYLAPTHFMWRPEWEARVGELFTFHDVWPAPHQTILDFPIPETRTDSGATALLMLPATYRPECDEQFGRNVDAFFEGLPTEVHVQVKCHPSDTDFLWLKRCQALHAEVREVDDRMMEAALYCYQHRIPYCFHFNSSSKEYFKFLPWEGEGEGSTRPEVIDLWPDPIRLVDILEMDPAQRPSSRFEYPLPSLAAEERGR